MRKIKLKFNSVLETIFLVLAIFLGAKNFLGYDFGLNLDLFSRVFLILFLFWCLLLAIEKRKKIYVFISVLIQKEKNKFHDHLLKNQRKISTPLRLLSLSQEGKVIKEVFWMCVYLVTVFDYAGRIFLKAFFSKYTIFVFFVGSWLINSALLNHYLADLTLIFMLFFWLLMIYKFKLKEEISYVISFSLLIGCLYYSIKRNNLWAEKFADWLYFFLFFAVVQSLIKKVRSNED